MKLFKIQKSLKNIFKQPKINFYLGSIKFYTPYFLPRNYNPFLIYIKKIKKDHSNIPLVRRSKNFIFKNYYVEIGWPLMFTKVNLGWKGKYNTPRFEWNPSYIFYFFKWQFVIYLNESDEYWEQVLWWKYYCNEDLEKAKSTWPWVSGENKKSTWNDNYLDM